MSEIPEDVQNFARQACDLCGVTPYSEMRVYAQHVATVAIRNERERSALAMKEAIESAPAGSDRETFILRAFRAILKEDFPFKNIRTHPSTTEQVDQP